MNRARSLLILPALVLPFVVGCGGGGNDSSSKLPSADPQLRAQAAVATETATAKSLANVHDRHLPGPRDYKVVCIEAGSKYAQGVPSNSIKCHVEAFYKPYRGKEGGYIGSEDWLVPFTNGKMGIPVLAGEDRIRAFLVADDKKNCSGRHEPDECTPPVPPSQ